MMQSKILKRYTDSLISMLLTNSTRSFMESNGFNINI